MEIITCPNCGEDIEYDNSDIIIGGYPHIECPNCGNDIAVF